MFENVFRTLPLLLGKKADEIVLEFLFQLDVSSF